MHAGLSRIGVSSAYHDDVSQVARIADGDLETAWNSRTGDLGAWIELAVPPDATVRAVALTTGFTHVTPRADLFTGNLRVSRVRLSRDGVTLGEYDLDTTSRALVEIPVNGPGGVFRLQVLVTAAGERADWREICGSEVRVFGISSSATADRSSPGTSIGPVVGVSSADEVAGSDGGRAAVEAAEDEEDPAQIDLSGCRSLLSTWESYSSRLTPYLHEPDAHSAQALQDVLQRRRTMFEGAAELFRDVSVDLAARASATAARNSADPWYERAADFDALIEGCEAMMARHPSEACGWAEARSLARLEDVVQIETWSALTWESIVERRENLEGLPLRGDELERAQRQLAAAHALNQWLERIHVEDWDELGHPRRTTLLASDLPSPTDVDWNALEADLQRTERDCGSTH